MAVGIVEALEVVDVHEDDRDLVAVAGGPVELRVEAREQGLAVHDPRQQVHRGHRPGLGHPLGEPAEAGLEARVADPRGAHEIARVRRVHEPVRQSSEAARLAPADHRRIPGCPGDGAEDPRSDDADDQAQGGREIGREGHLRGFGPTWSLGGRSPVPVIRSAPEADGPATGESLPRKGYPRHRAEVPSDGSSE